jgi:tetratricopeptide (TPR) repeat protein
MTKVNRIFCFLFFLLIAFSTTFGQTDAAEVDSDLDQHEMEVKTILDSAQITRLRRMGQYMEIVSLYKKAIKTDPENYVLWFQKGIFEQLNKQSAEAKSSYMRAIEYNKNYIPAYAKMALLYKQEKDLNTAIFYYDRAASFETNNARKLQYKLEIIRILLKREEFSKAKVYLLEAVQIAPQDINIHYYLGEVKSAEKDWEGAKKEYLFIVRSDKFENYMPEKQAKYYYALGEALLNLGSEEEAKIYWEKSFMVPYAKEIEKRRPKWATEWKLKYR